MVKTLFEILEPLEKDLQLAYKCGARVAPELIRDIEIYRDFNALDLPIMERYIILSEKYKLSETTIRDTVRSMRTVVV